MNMNDSPLMVSLVVGTFWFLLASLTLPTL